MSQFAIADQVVPGEILSALEQRIQIRRAVFVPLNPGLVAESQLAAGIGRARFLAEDDHFRIRMQQLPALERVPLRHGQQAAKRFRRRKKGNHRGPVPTAPALFKWLNSEATISSMIESRLRVTDQSG